MTPSRSSPDAATLVRTLGDRGSAAAARLVRRSLPVRQAVVRALDPRLTPRLRAERGQDDALSARLRRGSSIAVVGGAAQSGRTTVTALLALALAQYQGTGVLAVDSADSGDLYRRLAVRGDGSADAVLTELGVRTYSRPGPGQAVVRQRQLRQHLGLGTNVLLLATDPSMATPRLTAREYAPMAQALGRYVSTMVIDTPVLANESVVPAVVANADRIVVVGPDDDRGPAWVGACLPWVGKVMRQTQDGAVVGVLVGHARATKGNPVHAGKDVDVPMFRLPFDPGVGKGRGPVAWPDLAPATQHAVFGLAAHIVRGLTVAD